MKLTAILAAVRAALATLKGVFHKLGWTKAEAVVDATMTVDEAVNIVAAHGESGAAIAFLQAPAMASATFREYVGKLREAVELHRTKTGATLPLLVILPPGVTVQVVQEKAAAMEAAANSILSGGAQ